LTAIPHIPDTPKSSHLKIFDIFFSRTVESYDIKFYTLVTKLANLESFITLSTELTNIQYTAFSRGILAVETLSKIVSAIQDSANAVSEHFF